MRPMTRSCRQRGSLAVEVALLMPLLFGVGVVGSDMYRVGITRAELEQRNGSLTLTLAMQQQLTESGLQALVEVGTQDAPARYQLLILNVLQSGKVNWGFKRGAGGALCDSPVSGGLYTGELPEAMPAEQGDSSDDTSTFSYIVVHSCRSTADITLAGGVSLPDVLQVRTVQRAIILKPTLDESLTNENKATGLAYSES
ncbi:TadE/TadG family type IV pilus assembly protein [Uliginosibacterium sp. TH139]|uniref:TadE/TadG family type IV pilus assembly protein n=1 Tax=Uliginosibacterium sp. TH139 TaxID=2067453 RepID=UPI000C7C88BB|nr:hypothetical protein [Uliginosibacterium sp. TH139]PLK47686.1 hypothetical protein C0V76_14985 [Uliginosibacterium sp. TH139]